MFYNARLEIFQGAKFVENKKKSFRESEIKTVVRPALVYGAETRSTTKHQEKRLSEVNEMRMLRWMESRRKIKSEVNM